MSDRYVVRNIKTGRFIYNYRQVKNPLDAERFFKSTAICMVRTMQEDIAETKWEVVELLDVKLSKPVKIPVGKKARTT